MNISATINSFLKHFCYGPYRNPVRDWFIVLTVSMIALAGIFIWNVWAFDTVANGGVIGTATSTPQAFSQSSLNTIRSIFEDRAEERAKYETGTYRFSDPSQL